jgi:hypothetical protein
MVTREPLFPGKDYVHQLLLITEVSWQFTVQDFVFIIPFLGNFLIHFAEGQFNLRFACVWLA